MMATGLDVDVVVQEGGWAEHIKHPETLVHARAERIGVLPRGTANGLPTVMILGRDPKGQEVVIETTWALLRTACAALGGVWPEGATEPQFDSP